MAARVRYTGWTERGPARREHGVVTAGGPGLKRTITVNGRRFVFRGRAGKPSQWRTVEDREAIEQFEQQEDFEVQQDWS